MAEELVIRSADTAAGRAGLLQKIAAGLCINAVFLTPPHTPSTDLTPLALCILLTLGFSFAALYLDIFSKQLKLSLNTLPSLRSQHLLRIHRKKPEQ